MKEKDLISTLITQGWTCNRDEVGDYICLTEIEGKTVQIIPSVKKRTDHFRVSFTPSVSTKEFTETVSFLFKKVCGHSPIITNNTPPEKLTKLSHDEVINISDKAISWACIQNIESGLMAYKNLPTNSKGAMPLRHLAALAITGEVEKLEYYKTSFERGDRLGFVPYITHDMIVRAIFKSIKKE